MEGAALVGCWRLLAWEVEAGGERRQLFGARPRGRLILTPAGQVMALTVATQRLAGDADAERAALHRSMVAYSGRYRVEGGEFITTVEVSWNEAWNGSEQRRRFRVEEPRLYIESAPAPSLFFPGEVDVRRLVWEREAP